jgi:YjbE family integral membrane protein
MSVITSPVFWLALFQIILINIVLSGDNAVVIALACRSLPAKQQKKAIIFGSIGAIVLRVILTFFAVYLLTLPYLKLVGAALLLWIGIGLLKGDDEEEEIEGNSGLIAAVKTIIVADLVMSLDNVIGVAAAAKGDLLLLVLGLVISIPLIVFGSTIIIADAVMSLDNVIAIAAAAKGHLLLIIIGLGISIPLIIFGSTLILKLMGRFPVIITLGAGLLGWVAGEMAISDPSVAGWVEHHHWLHTVAPATGAIVVIAIGKWLASRAGGDDAQQQGAAADQPAA